MMTEFSWHVKSFDELSLNQLYQILQIRQKVFVVEQACSYIDADGADKKSLHLWAERNGEICAYCRLLPAGMKYTEASIGRVLTSSEYRNIGLGKTLMVLAMQVIETRFATTSIRISAQDYLISFYENLGFQATSKKYFEDQIPHTEMYKD